MNYNFFILFLPLCKIKTCYLLLTPKEIKDVNDGEEDTYNNNNNSINNGTK